MRHAGDPALVREVTLGNETGTLGNMRRELHGQFTQHRSRGLLADHLASAGATYCHHQQRYREDGNRLPRHAPAAPVRQLGRGMGQEGGERQDSQDANIAKPAVGELHADDVVRIPTQEQVGNPQIRKGRHYQRECPWLALLEPMDREQPAGQQQPYQ
jgi:hypothetical protein